MHFSDFIAQFQKEKGVTKLDENNAFWNAFSSGLEERYIRIQVSINRAFYIGIVFLSIGIPNDAYTTRSQF